MVEGNAVKKIRLKVIHPTDIDSTCKDYLFKTSSKFHACKESKGTDCIQQARKNAGNYFQKAMAMDSSVVESKYCKDLLSISRVS